MIATVTMTLELELDDEEISMHKDMLEDQHGKDAADDLMSEESIEKEIIDDMKHCRILLPHYSLIEEWLVYITVEDVSVSLSGYHD